MSRLLSIAFWSTANLTYRLLRRVDSECREWCSRGPPRGDGRGGGGGDCRLLRH